MEIAVPREGATRDVAAALAELCPEMVGRIVRDDRSGLQESYTFNLNGRTFVSEGQLHLEPGDTLLLFSSQAGG